MTTHQTITEADRKLLSDAAGDSELMRYRCNEIWVIACLAVTALDAFETGRKMLEDVR